MIKTVQIRVSAGHPDMPLEPSAVIHGSAATIGVLDVPRRRCGVDITSVAVTIENADGTADTEPAKLVAGVWCATFPADYFATPGFVQNGVTVTAGGKDENEIVREWILGRGDFEVLSAAAVPQPGEYWQNVHYRAEVPNTPVVGDLAKIDGAWKLYTDQGWQTLGGGSGGGAVDSVNGQTGVVVLTGADIMKDDSGIEETVADAIVGLGTDLGAHIQDTENPHHVTAKQLGAATADELIVRIDLVGDGTAANPYAIQLDGVTQTFDQIKTFAESRNAVIRHGQGTYRVTYVGNGEMMWDCTGTVQGVVKSGMIHIFREGNVVQLVAAKSLAEKSEVQAAQAAADGAIGFSTYPIKAVVNGQLLDRTVNTSTGGAFTFPTSGTGARDFVVVVAASSTAPSVSFPSSGVTYFSDDDAVWTAEADKVNVWYFTEIAANQFMVAHKALAQTAQA